jgi:hypothetical protein
VKAARSGSVGVMAMLVVLATTPGAASTEAQARRPSTCYRVAAPSSDRAIDLVDATDDLGLDQPLIGQFGHAVAVGDVDDDGWLDLFVGTFADKPLEDYQARGASGPSPDRLLLGGPGGFRADPGFEVALGRTSGAVFADLDGDRDLDLVLARNVKDIERGRAPSLILENDGSGHFAVAQELPSDLHGRSIGVLDYDGDARPDLFIAEDHFSGESSRLLHNDGDLQFSDATRDAGLPLDIDGLGVAATDLNGDARTDLFVGGANRLFVNTGGAFREAGIGDFAWRRYGEEDTPAGVAVGDVNRDSRPDLLVGHHYSSALEGRPTPVRLYVNDGIDRSGAPKFRDVTAASGLTALSTKAPHVEIVDVDRDGWPDVLTSASADHGRIPAVFRSLGVADGGTPRFEAPDGLGSPQYWVAGATFDADRDGRLDVFLAEWYPEIGSKLFRGLGGRGHWLGVELGRAGTQGLGANVSVYERGRGGQASALIGQQEITASNGYASGAAPIAIFGLGDHSVVDLVVNEAHVRNVAADRLVGFGGRGCGAS